MADFGFGSYLLNFGNDGSPPGTSLLGAYDNVPWKTPEQLLAEQASPLPVESSAYGEVLPLIRGSVRLPCRTIWRSPVRERFARTEGKGGDPQPDRFLGYEVDVALAICDNILGDTIKLLRLWADKTTILIDLTTGQQTSTDNVPHYRFYDGSQTAVDPTISTREGPAHTPAFIKTCVLVLQALDITAYGGRIPIFEVEISATSEVNTDPGFAIPYLVDIGDGFVPDKGGCFDWSSGLLYTLIADDNYATNHFTQVTLSLDSEKELRRAPIQSLAYSNYTHPVAMPGAPYVLYSAKPADHIGHNVVVNTETGILTAIESADEDHDTEWVGAKPIIGAPTTQFLCIGRYMTESGGTGTTVAVFDATAKTLVIVDRNNPATTERVFSFGARYAGGKVVFYGLNGSDVVETTYLGGDLASTTVYSNGDTPDGLFYDASDHSVVVSGAGYIRKAPLVGGAGVSYDVDPVPGSTYQAVIGGKYQKFPGPIRDHYADLHPGYAMVLVNAGGGDDDGVYLVDTIDGSLVS